MAFIERRVVSPQDPPVALLRLPKGKGALESVYMSFFENKDSFLYAERNINIYYNQEATAPLETSGTEDFFMASWGWATGAYATAFHGAPVKQPRPGFVTAYRYFREPSPFEKGVEILWEPGAKDTRESGGAVMLWSVVTYWLEED